MWTTAGDDGERWEWEVVILGGESERTRVDGRE